MHERLSGDSLFLRSFTDCETDHTKRNAINER